MNQMESFKDILIPRREEFSNLLWVSRKLETVLSYKQNKRPKPETHKKEVLSSARITEIVQKLSDETGQPRQVMESTVKLILDEIGFNKQLKIIRWLGLVLAKINQKIYTGIHVNEDSINRLKSAMGKCPVVFAPSHRSYADFILMSYICFTYDLEIPAIAAGMDFHGMWGMGSVLRDTGAFFMRRSFNDDVLYWETFKQYVYQIVTRGDLPVEFFIEGTRSRSCKSLIPKFGLLSMILKPLFTAEVPDVLLVPINISYDRVLEEKLFAFELLGIPKPKESTSGFFKSLSIIKENYGNIYVDFTTPISAKQYFGEKLNRLSHSVAPLNHQQLDFEDRTLITDIGYEILRVQRQHAVLLPFNIAAVFLSLYNNYSLSSLAADIKWLQEILKILGARVSEGSLEKAFEVHSGLVHVNNVGNIEFIRNDVNLDNIDASKLKAHRLSNETMTNIIPHIMLQLYVNPTLHYFANCSLVTVAILTFGQARRISRDELFDSFRLLRAIFSFEFAFYNKKDDMVFEDTLQKLQLLNVIEIINEDIILHNNDKLQVLLLNLFSPFITAYCYLCDVLRTMNAMSLVDHTTLLTETQKQLESDFVSIKNVHPYALNLDTLSICLQSLLNLEVLAKVKKNRELKYNLNMEKLNMISAKLNMIAAKCYKNFSVQSKQAPINNLPAKL